MISERSARLRSYIHSMLDAGVRRTTFYPLISESLEQTRGEPRPIRRAKAFAYLLDRVEQVVLPDELIAGSITGMWPLVEDRAMPGSSAFEQLLMEARQVVEEHLKRRAERSTRKAVQRWALMARDHYDASIRFADLQKVAQHLVQELDDRIDLPYGELYRLLEDHFVFDYGERVRQNFAELPWFASNHLDLNYKKVLRRGLGDLRREILERRAQASDQVKQEFYTSTLIAMDAVIRFIRRYARTLEQESKKAEPGRAAELHQMAAICEAVAENSPQTFRQAIQLLWMIHIIGNIAGGSALSFARFDQYLYPFYQKDLEAGRIQRDEAKELVTHLWLKVNEPKMRTVQSLTLSGIGRDGRDGTNELTYICLEVVAEAAEPYPNTCVRLHKNSPEALWDKVVETLLVGIGQPQIFNDDAMLPGLVALGYPIEDSRDYYPMGCVEVMLEGLQPTYQAAEGVVFPGLIEHVFNNGGVNLAGEPGYPTGELSSFQTFEDFLNAYLTQVRMRVLASLKEQEEHFLNAQSPYFDPFASILVDDCLTKGVDLCQGGARYPASITINGLGFGTAVDSLAAIKTFVYERGQFSLEEIKEMLDSNYEGRESARLLLASSPPAFGNDLEEVDRIAQKVYSTFVDTILGYQPSSEDRSMSKMIFHPQMFSYTSHVYRGEATAATPNGRRRGEVLSDGPGPSQGRDGRGPTCLINSITCLDGSKLTGGCGFNIKISPDFTQGAEGQAILKSLLRAYLAKNGMQIQVNLIDQETLRKAQEDPDRYRNIIVRVAGYCEYFTNLDRKLQDEIIRRTAQR